MEQEYTVHGPEASYVQQYGPPHSPQTQRHLHEMQPPHWSQHSLADYHKRSGGRGPRTGPTGGFETQEAECASGIGRGDSDTASGSSRKKNSDYDNETGEDSRFARTAPEGKKQIHSEIEKRRRDKMNTYITELSSMIPMCGAMSRKVDKLTVLRMAVQHLKSVHGATHAYPEGSFRPEFLSERELRMLILQAADGFLFVADCDRGRMMYVSESVTKALHYSQNDLLGQSLFDILHPKDVEKVKEQLSSPDITSRGRLIDAKTMLPVHMDVVMSNSRLSPGARRSFFCRIKVKPGHGRDGLLIKQEQETSRYMDRKYCVVHCTGYLKAWSGGELSGANARVSSAVDDGAGSTGSLSCLVAVGRTMPQLPQHSDRPPTRRLQFVSRHAPDGKFVYVDQRVTPAVGYLPQELHGTSLYEYVAQPHVHDLARGHKAALQTRAPQCSAPYAFRRKDRTWASVQTEWRPFRNPWTKEVECLVAHNTLLELYVDTPQTAPDRHPNTYFARDNDHEMQQAISSQLESHKIGSTIADEVLHHAPLSADSTPDLHQEIVPDLQQYTHDDDENGDDNSLEQSSLSHYSLVRNNVALSEGAPPEIEDVLRIIAAPSAAQENLPADENDEAAMAVIMSLLEADAGLGGHVDFSGLPWPLP